MKQFFTIGTMFLVSMVLAFVSCSKTECDIRTATDEQGEITLKDLSLGSTVVYTLWAAETIDVGTVSITKKSGIVTVTYATVDGWELETTHIHAEYDWLEIPQANGNPVLGQFQYVNVHDPAVSTFSRTLDEDYFGCFYIAVHAEVIKEASLEQAWADGIEFPGNQWATYIYYEPPWIGKPK